MNEKVNGTNQVTMCKYVSTIKCEFPTQDWRCAGCHVKESILQSMLGNRIKETLPYKGDNFY